MTAKSDAVQLGHRPITCFKAYDLRGKLGENLDKDVAYRVGRAFAQHRGAQRVVVGHDTRETSPELAAALIEGLTDGGADVLDLGLAGTEEVYFATGYEKADGGVEVTASHNPIEYNGMKIVGPGAAPLNPATEMLSLQRFAEQGDFAPAEKGEVLDRKDLRSNYAQAMVDFIDVDTLRPLKILVNAGNGTAGPTFDAVADALEKAGAPFEFVRMYHDADSSFPHGIPNPLLLENQPVTAEAVREHKADMGVAWDGDFDRCFFFDDKGRFIPGEYIVGLLAAAFLERHPGESIVHDPRVVMNTRAIVAEAGGVAVQCRTGHAFVKRSMRDNSAIYGGEMSAHHYFRDFYYCDSGMVPWLLIAELMGRKNSSLAEMLDDRMTRYPSSGEVNYHIEDPDAAIARIEAEYAPRATDIDRMDGIAMEFADGWRFSLRKSNTEPVVRLNLEADGDADLLATRQKELQALLTD